MPTTKNRYAPIANFPQGPMGAFLTGFAGAGPKFAEGFMAGDQIRRQQEEDALRKILTTAQIGQTVPGMSITPELFQEAGMGEIEAPVDIKTTWEAEDIREEKRYEKLDKRKRESMQRIAGAAKFLNEHEDADLMAAAQEFNIDVEELGTVKEVVEYAKANKLTKSARSEFVEMMASGKFDMEDNPSGVFNWLVKWSGPQGIMAFGDAIKIYMQQQQLNMSDKNTARQLKASFFSSMMKTYKPSTVTKLWDVYSGNKEITPELELQVSTELARSSLGKDPAMQINIDRTKERLIKIAAANGEILADHVAEAKAMDLVMRGKEMTRKEFMLKWMESSREASFVFERLDPEDKQKFQQQWASEGGEIYDLVNEDNSGKIGGNKESNKKGKEATPEKKPVANSPDALADEFLTRRFGAD